MFLLRQNIAPFLAAEQQERLRFTGMNMIIITIMTICLLITTQRRQGNVR
jgi:hypothetical protein